MRLTLRSLLAYLDDILEPAQAKEIGAKIAQSDFASTLSARIKDVLRRRRLMAPDVDGPAMGVDPNQVAEYLDNTLSNNAVVEVERIFLESDLHLAEVAACHQILTLVLGEPVEIVPESRERMYALGPEPKYDERLVETMEGNGKQEVVGATQESAQSVPAKEPAKSFSESLPAQLRRKPLWKRAFPYVLVLVLIAVFVGVVATDPSLVPFWGDDEDQPGGPMVAQNDDKKSAPQKSEPNKVGRKQQPVRKTGDLVAANVPNGKLPLPPLPNGANLKPPPDVPERKNGKRAVGKRPAVVARVPDGGKPPVGKGKQPTVKPPVAGKAPTMQYVLPSAIGQLLRFDAKSKDWFVMAPRSLVKAGDRLASPEPFDSLIEIAGGRARVVLQSGTQVALLPANEAGAFGFELRRGRLVIKRAAGTAKSKTPLVLALRIHGELFRLELLAPQTVCGIELTPATPNGFEKGLGKDAYTGGVYVSAGSVRLTNSRRESVGIEAGWLSLKPSDLEAAAGKGDAAVHKAAGPSWLTPAIRPLGLSAQRFSKLYVKEFEVDGITKDGQSRISMLDNATAIVRDRRALVSQYAVQALAVTESYAELVKALSIAPHEESRRAAIEGLRTWLPASPGNGKKLRTQLGRVFTASDADIVYRLLWGYSEKDARDEVTSLTLVDWLNHNHIAVRELAFLHVHRLTRRRYDYRANLLASQRTLAVNRWIMHVNRVGALLPPKP
ncbi:MAG: hypothetical protein ACE5KM_19965 [Planctomycetaceae bacterium]